MRYMDSLTKNQRKRNIAISYIDEQNVAEYNKLIMYKIEVILLEYCNPYYIFSLYVYMNESFIIVSIFLPLVNQNVLNKVAKLRK